MKKRNVTMLAGMMAMTLFLSACGGSAKAPETGKPGAVAEVGENSADQKDDESKKTEIPKGAMKIGSAADMEKFLKAVNEDGKTEQNAVLTADIDLSEGYGQGTEGWPGIQKYSGIFDGDGHSISGYVIQDPSANYTGFFNNCTEESIIRNVEIRDVTIEVSSGGALVGDSDGIVENCNISAVVKGSSVAGVAGFVETIRDCLFTGTVEGESDAAGIANRARIVENCRNEGSITCTEGKDTNDELAGIVGAFFPADGDRVPILRGCVNTGSVSGERCAAGGIAGSACGVTVEDCVNEGDVSGLLAGGIIGRSYYEDKDGSVIKNCGNSGHIRGVGDKYAESFAGGILGRIAQKDTVINCYSTGTIESGYQAGGIVGQSMDANRKIIRNCYSSGSITAKLEDRSNSLAAGIVAGLASECKNCYTMAEVEANGAEYVRAIWEDKKEEPEGCYYIDTIQEIRDGAPVETSAALGASAFTDGTLLDLLNAGAKELGEEACGWKQGEQGPELDWQ